MKNETISCLCGLALVGAAHQAMADARENPYQRIVEVNAFRLLPKPPPPPPPDPNPPAAPPATIILTGISTLNGPPKVLLEITDALTKKIDRPPPLLVGEKQGTVEIVSIDPDKGAVTIKNSGSEMTLTFEKNGIKPTGAAPAPVAMIQPPMTGAVPVPFPGNTLSSPGAVHGGGNVVMAGGSSSTAAGGNPSTGFINPNPAFSSGLIPPRPTRGVLTSGDNNNYNPNAPRQLTREEAILVIEAQRLNSNRVGPPLPPTPLTPPGSPGAPTPPSLPAFPTLPNRIR